MSAAIADHYTFFHEREHVTYEVAKKGGNVLFPVTDALRGQLDFREMAASNGRYITGDISFSIPQEILSPLSITPKMGDVIVDSSNQRWTCLNAAFGVVRTMHRLVCRNLKIAYDLRDLVTIKRATNTTDNAGVRVATYATIASSISGRLQEIQSSGFEARGKRGDNRTFQVYLETEYDLTTDDLVEVDGRQYAVTGWRNKERIDEFFIVDCNLIFGGK